MRASEWRVEQAATSSADPQLKLVASLVLDDPGTRQLWELEHSRYMRAVADQQRSDRQRVALRLVAFGLIHRKALFEYLRESDFRGDGRQRVVALLHGSRDYAESVVAEHRLYIRASASQLCATHIGCSVVGDPAFDEPFGEYERRYLDYFALFCQAHVRPADDAQLEHMLLPQLKLRVAEQRAAILALDGARPRCWRPLVVNGSARNAAARPGAVLRFSPADQPAALRLYG